MVKFRACPHPPKNPDQCPSHQCPPEIHLTFPQHYPICIVFPHLLEGSALLLGRGEYFHRLFSPWPARKYQVSVITSTHRVLMPQLPEDAVIARRGLSVGGPAKPPRCEELWGSGGDMGKTWVGRGLVVCCRGMEKG